MYIGSDAADVVTVLAKLCQDYGVPVTCTTDGGPQYTAEVLRKFMDYYGIHHRLCSVANPHANTRAEVAVRTVKRMIGDCRVFSDNVTVPQYSGQRYKNVASHVSVWSKVTGFHPTASRRSSWVNVERDCRRQGEGSAAKGTGGARKMVSTRKKTPAFDGCR